MANNAAQSSNKEADWGHAHLTAEDIKNCRNQLTDIIIAPFDTAKAKGVGYNFSLSEMIYSITRKRLVPICRGTNETYFYLHPHETILALSYEYLKVDKWIAGSFHSRVRMTAQGIGSISTTLDPSWNGMLLFSLNNPTRKKIKIVLSTRSDGVIKTNSVITLLTWRTTQKRSQEEKMDVTEPLALHLDNPPMRIDIWSELTARPLRLFRNRDYQRFCRLVDSLSPFDSQPSQAVSWATELLQLLTELKIAIHSKASKEAIRAVLIRIDSQKELPQTVKDCLYALTKELKTDELVQICLSEEYTAAVELAERELQYQILCDQISQIHAMISKQVPTSWHRNFWANIWYQVLKNLNVIVATLVFILLLLYGKYAADPNYWLQLVLAFMPLVVSVICSIISERK